MTNRTPAEKQISKLDVTIRQWKEILDKQMNNISADLLSRARNRSIHHASQAEAKKKEIEIYGL